MARDADRGMLGPMASPAPACRQALADATARWPTRNKSSDGIMGDASHQARKSDHNLGNAVDVTHDPRSGCTGSIIAAHAVRDSRVKYVIFNRRINTRDGRGWRRYTGKNAHTGHCHISIRAAVRTDNSHWGWVNSANDRNLELPPAPDNAPAAAGPAGYPGRPVRRGQSGSAVRKIQLQLRKLGWEIGVDGDFGPETERVVKKFQARKALEVDGIVGVRTWRALWGL
jgi:hypothetical protein